MDSNKPNREGNSLRKLGRAIIRHYTRKGKEKSDDNRDDNWAWGGAVDTDWIDIEMMGAWRQKCDVDHGHECRGPFGLNPSSLGHPDLLIDIKRKFLRPAGLNDRYACLSYV
jgi:hypothetical protein